MDGNIDPTVMATLLPSMQRRLLVQVSVHVYLILALESSGFLAFWLCTFLLLLYLIVYIDAT